jgi:hypothetical protein
MMASAMVQLPTGSGESFDMGFGTSNQFLTVTTSGSGPWIQVFGNGTINFYGGVALNNQVYMPNAFTGDGSPVQVFLTYDAFHVTASVGTVRGGVTNLILNQWPVTNTLNAITAKYMLLQFSTNLAEYGFMKSKQDVGWFDKVVAAIHRHWRNKNARKRTRQAQPA